MNAHDGEAMLKHLERALEDFRDESDRRGAPRPATMRAVLDVIGRVLKAVQEEQRSIRLRREADQRAEQRTEETTDARDYSRRWHG